VSSSAVVALAILILRSSARSGVDPSCVTTSCCRRAARLSCVSSGTSLDCANPKRSPLSSSQLLTDSSLMSSKSLRIKRCALGFTPFFSRTSLTVRSRCALDKPSSCSVSSLIRFSSDRFAFRNFFNKSLPSIWHIDFGI
jgi:hypothetical protein